MSYLSERFEKHMFFMCLNKLTVNRMVLYHNRYCWMSHNNSMKSKSLYPLCMYVCVCSFSDRIHIFVLTWAVRSFHTFPLYSSERVCGRKMRGGGGVVFHAKVFIMVVSPTSNLSAWKAMPLKNYIIYFIACITL